VLLCVGRCYASADVFLFPSLTDTFGNVVLKALASSLVVVAYNVAATSRVALGLHYPSDVLVGAVLGWIPSHLALRV
jgi:membrane-associated phospholipid phosphatase